MNINTHTTGAGRLASAPISRETFSKAIEAAYDVSAILDLIGRVEDLAEGINPDNGEGLAFSIRRVSGLANRMMDDIIEQMDTAEMRFLA